MSKTNAASTTKEGSAIVRYDREKAMPVVLEGITNGESLRTVCKRKGMPAPSTVCLWLSEDSRLAEQYARARESAGLLVGEEIEEIARQVLRGEHNPHAARVAIDALKWTAARKAPKVYGDSTRLHLKGSVVALTAFADMARPTKREDERDGHDAPGLPHMVAPDGADES